VTEQPDDDLVRFPTRKEAVLHVLVYLTVALPVWYYVLQFFGVVG
jgi:hypothetical protein